MRAFSLVTAAAVAAALTNTAFNVDVSSTSVAFLPTILDSFGSSHASTTLRATWRQHLQQTKADMPALKHVRFHGLFDDDMSTYLPSGATAPYGGANGALAMDTLDFLLSIGVRPTVEISFMPEALAVDPSATTFHYKGGISLPANFSKWSAVVQGLLQQFVDRYGIDEVATWFVETWNEPDCEFLSPGNNCCGADCGNLTAYGELYAATAAGVKAVSPRLQVGGPATAQLGWIAQFIAQCKAQGVPLDFVSSHLYPNDPASVVNQTRDGFSQAIAAAAHTAAAAAGVPLVITEFNAGLGVVAAGQPALDTSYAGAFLLHQHLALQSVPNLVSMSFWTFTDFGFEESGVDPLPYNNKYGIRNSQGVPKPSYRALQWVSEQLQAGATALNVSANPSSSGTTYTNLQGQVVGATTGTVDVTACSYPATSGTGAAAGAAQQQYAILLSNYDLASSAVPDVTNVTLTITGFTGALPTSATLQVYDYTQGSAYAAWRAAGSPLFPSPAQVSQLMAASVAPTNQVPLQASGSNAVTVTVQLQPYAFGRLAFTA